MKRITCLFIVMFLAITAGVFAQNQSRHIYHVVTWYSVPGLDSAARAGRDAVLKEYMEKVDKKNQYILSERNLRHFFSEDSREMITIFEYASLADMEKAGDRDEELIKTGWPDVKQRDDFMKKMNSYFTHHKDAIYSDMGMTK